MKRKYKEFKKENCQKKRDKRKEQVGKKFKTEGKKEAITTNWRGQQQKKKSLKTLLTELQS